LFLFNIFPVVLTWFLTFVTHQLSLKIHKLLQEYISNEILSIKTSMKSNIKIRFGYYILNLNYLPDFLYKGLIRLYLTTCLDINVAIFL